MKPLAVVEVAAPFCLAAVVRRVALMAWRGIESTSRGGGLQRVPLHPSETKLFTASAMESIILAASWERVSV